MEMVVVVTVIMVLSLLLFFMLFYFIWLWCGCMNGRFDVFLGMRQCVARAPHSTIICPGGGV